MSRGPAHAYPVALPGYPLYLLAFVEQDKSVGRVADDVVREALRLVFKIGQAHRYLRLAMIYGDSFFAAGVVSAGTADLVIRNIPMIDFVRPVGIMDAFLFIRSGLKRLFFLGYARHFPTSVALAAPGRDRLCLLQDRFRRGNCRFFQRVIVIAFCIRKAPQATGQGQRHGPQDRDDLFHRKALPFSRYFAFCQGVIPNTIVSYRFLLFNHRFNFCIILRFSWFCVIGLPAVLFALPWVGGPTLHPGLSNFYQNAAEGRFRLIFPCF